MPIPANHVNRSEEQSESGERGDETEGRPLFQWRARLPSLDGWRAISLVLVLGSHTAITAGTPPLAAKVLNRVFDGALGVRFFFVISGFLITWLMMVENQRTGTVSLRHFYVRRALRILPVYLVFLGVLAGLQWCTPLHQSAALWVGNLTFTTNFLYEPGMNGHQSAHLWSLAVEEQFYLLWPVAFLWLRGKEPLKVACWLVGGAVAVVLLNRWLERLPEVMSTGLGRLFQEWSFFNSVDSLAMGCAAALLLGRYPQQV
ncbi:MAG: putative acyltransferase, partial [Verrucomicrobiaceae bacterium]|nr:putative acyltransferase [Verrucomicrobiaceae bacterium]